MQAQTQTQWCWAATSASVSRYYNTGSAWTQCLLANQQLNQTTCCINGSSAQCNQPSTLNTTLGITGNLLSWQAGSVSLTVLAGEIAKRCPVATRIGWSGGGGHFMVIEGARASNSFIHIDDPIFGETNMAIGTYSTAYQGTGSWTHTYFTQP